MKKRVAVIGIIIFCFWIMGCSNMIDGMYDNDKAIKDTSNSYNLGEETQNIEGLNYLGTVEFEGMDTIWKYETTEKETLKISFSLNIEAGEAKLVYISPEGDIQTLVDKSTDSMIYQEIELEKGLNRIKVMAKNKAKLDLTLQVSSGELKRLGF